MVTVAAAQPALVPGDVAANLARHLAVVEEARAAGAELLVFPELSLTDYLAAPDPGLARPADAPELLALARAARGVAVVAGFIEANPGGGKPFNAAALLAEGRVVHVHRKLNLPTYGSLAEGYHYAPGAALDPAPTPLGPTALMICADTWNPALPWLAALAGAEALAVPVASSRGAVAEAFDSRAGWRVNLAHAALTYGLPVVMANHCGRRGPFDFWGGSTILDATGRVVAELGAEPGLAVARIDPADGALARARLPTVRDAAPALMHGLLGRLLAQRSARPPQPGAAPAK
jgi:predicted amidohydrolase